MDTFFVGLHQPNHAIHFDHVMISIHRLAAMDAEGMYMLRKDGSPRVRCSPAGGDAEILIDAGAFKKLELYGRYPDTPEKYAANICALVDILGNVVGGVSEDYMCEAWILKRTGMTIPQHQALTIERYDRILAAVAGKTYIMPVLQGFLPAEYVDHLRQYGARLAQGAWVGVGSVCKRQGDVKAIIRVLGAIKQERPDLRLHGFGVKLTALESAKVRELLSTADSMAWSYAARKQGRDGNSYKEAMSFDNRIRTQPVKPASPQTEMYY